MKLLNSEIAKRIEVANDRSITDDITSGIVSFGKENDYSENIENLILGSQTGKSTYNVFSKFIAGNGFANSEIGEIVVGRDVLGKPITLDKLRVTIAQSLAMHGGVFLHANFNLNNEVTDVRLLNFKNCRFSIPDDSGYIARIAYKSNGFVKSKKGSVAKNNSENAFDFFYIFNPAHIQEQVGVLGGFENFHGQIYHSFLEDTYIYPLSPFDSVYLDMDTENQIQLFKNRELRNGFTDKIVMVVENPEDDHKRAELVQKTQNFMGVEGEKLLLFTADFDDLGNISGNNFKIERINTNINDKLFSEWEISIANNIRKSAYGLPAVLIDYQQGTLSAGSGEMIEQATDVYNAYTRDLRLHLSQIFSDIFKYSKFENLKSITDFSILDVKF